MATAQYIRWSSELAIGIETVDEQHQRIVQYINSLVDARESGDQAMVEEVLSGLVEYTVLHFQFEEELMEQAGYAFIEAHKKIHELFVKKIKGYVARFHAGEDIAEELLRMLTQWLVQHIRTEDADYKIAVTASIGSEGGRPSWIRRSLQRIFGQAA